MKAQRADVLSAGVEERIPPASSIGCLWTHQQRRGWAVGRGRSSLHTKVAEEIPPGKNRSIKHTSNCTLCSGYVGCTSAQQGAIKLEALQVVHQVNTLAVEKSKGVLPWPEAACSCDGLCQLQPVSWCSFMFLMSWWMWMKLCLVKALCLCVGEGTQQN